MRQLPRRAMTPKVTLARSTSPFVTVVSLIIAILLLGASLAYAVLSLSDPQSPALYLAAPLVFMPAFAVMALSVWADEELFDFKSAQVVGALALVLHLFVLYQEVPRISASPGTLIPLDQIIVNNYPSLRSAGPALAIGTFIVELVLYVLINVWSSHRRAYLLALSRYQLRQITTSKQTDKQLARGAKQRADALRKNTYQRALRNSARRSLMRWSIVEMVVVGAVAIIALINPSAGAFYRAPFLFAASAAAAAEYAFFGTTPPSWSLVSLIFSALALIYSVTGAVFDVARALRCFVNSQTPRGVIETRICNHEGWLGLVVPIALVVIALLSILQITFLYRLLMAESDAVQRDDDSNE